MCNARIYNWMNIYGHYYTLQYSPYLRILFTQNFPLLRLFLYVIEKYFIVYIQFLFNNNIFQKQIIL